MDELEARFELLKAEMAELQQGIRAQDVIALQVKGWAVTVGLAASGVAVTAHVPIAALLGLFSSLAFWLIDAFRALVQAHFLARYWEIEDALNASTVAAALQSNALHVPALGRYFPDSGLQRYVDVLRLALRPGTALLYVVLGLVLVLVAIVA